MNITIQGPEESFVIQLPVRSTIEDLKDAIVEKKKGYDKEKLNLRAGENDLIVNDLLDSVGVKDGSIVTLSFVKPSARPYPNIHSYGQGPNTTIPGTSSYVGNGGGMEASQRQQPIPRPEPPRPDPETVRKINKLVNMGFIKEQAEVAIRKAKGVVQVAASFLPLSEHEIKSDPIVEHPRPAYNPVGTTNVGRNTVRSERVEQNYIPDQPEDEVLRSRMYELIFDPVSREAIEIALREAFPGDRTRSGGDFLTDLAEEALTTKKCMRLLQPERKQAVKQLCSLGLPGSASIQILSEAGWDVNAAIQKLQAMFGGQRNQVTGQGARANVRPQVVTGMPGINTVPVRDPTRGPRFSGAGVREPEQVNRNKLGTTLDEEREAAENSPDNEQTEQVRIQGNRIEEELY